MPCTVYYVLPMRAGMYYLRTRPAADAIQFTVDQQALAKPGADHALPALPSVVGVCLSIYRTTPHIPHTLTGNDVIGSLWSCSCGGGGVDADRLWCKRRGDSARRRRRRAPLPHGGRLPHVQQLAPGASNKVSLLPALFAPYTHARTRARTHTHGVQDDGRHATGRQARGRRKCPCYR